MVTVFEYKLIDKKKIILNKTKFSIKDSDYDFFAETIFSGISPGTELAAFNGERPLRSFVSYPRLLGYLNLAQIIKVYGDSQFNVGDIILTHKNHTSHFFANDSEVINLIKSPCPKMMVFSHLYFLGLCSLGNKFIEITSKKERILIGLGAISSAIIDICNLFEIPLTVVTSRHQHNTKRIRYIPRNNDLEIFENKFQHCILSSNEWSDYKISLKLLNENGNLTLLGFPGRNKITPDFNPLDAWFFYAKNLSITSLPPIPKGKNFNNKIETYNFITESIYNNKLGSSFENCPELQFRELEVAYNLLSNRDEDNNYNSVILNWKSK